MKISRLLLNDRVPPHLRPSFRLIFFTPAVPSIPKEHFSGWPASARFILEHSPPGLRAIFRIKRAIALGDIVRPAKSQPGRRSIDGLAAPLQFQKIAYRSFIELHDHMGDAWQAIRRPIFFIAELRRKPQCSENLRYRTLIAGPDLSLFPHLVRLGRVTRILAVMCRAPVSSNLSPISLFMIFHGPLIGQRYRFVGILAPSFAKFPRSANLPLNAYPNHLPAPRQRAVPRIVKRVHFVDARPGGLGPKARQFLPQGAAIRDAQFDFNFQWDFRRIISQCGSRTSQRKFSLKRIADSQRSLV